MKLCRTALTFNSSIYSAAVFLTLSFAVTAAETNVNAEASAEIITIGGTKIARKINETGPTVTTINSEEISALIAQIYQIYWVMSPFCRLQVALSQRAEIL
jgi:hypothetical protein